MNARLEATGKCRSCGLRMVVMRSAKGFTSHHAEPFCAYYRKLIEQDEELMLEKDGGQ